MDESGDLVPGVEVVPGDARVRIDVARELAYAVLPVVVDLTGEPAAGYRVGGVSVDPATVTVSGEAPAVERLSAIVTAPVSVDGLMADRTRTVALELPPEISLIGEPQAQVAVDHRAGARLPDPPGRDWSSSGPGAIGPPRCRPDPSW